MHSYVDKNLFLKKKWVLQVASSRRVAIWTRLSTYQRMRSQTLETEVSRHEQYSAY
jgi:hypothetical protein